MPKAEQTPLDRVLGLIERYIARLEIERKCEIDYNINEVIFMKRTKKEVKKEVKKVAKKKSNKK